MVNLFRITPSGRGPAAGRPAGRLRPAEADGGQGAHPLLRRRGRVAGGVPHPGPLLAGHGRLTLRRERRAGRPHRHPQPHLRQVARALDVADRDAGRAGDRDRARALAVDGDPAPRDRLRAGHRGPDPDPLQLRHPRGRSGDRAREPQVQPARPVRARPLAATRSASSTGASASCSRWGSTRCRTASPQMLASAVLQLDADHVEPSAVPTFSRRVGREGAAPDRSARLRRSVPIRARVDEDRSGRDRGARSGRTTST